MNWLQELIEDNNVVETPQSWLYWSFLSCISAIAANNYTLRTLKGNLLYYPNLYIILLGESGLGKGYPINFAKKLVQAADSTRVIAGRSSIQAIVKELSTTKSEKGKPIITDSRGFIVNGELSTAIIQDPDSLTILTDLYDRAYNPTWTNMLKGDGHERLKEPYISCLFGSSPAHFYDSIPQVNIEGGFIGRNLIIYEEKRSKDVDLLDNEKESIDEDKFTNYFLPKYLPKLIEIASNKKRLIPNEEARTIFNTWRMSWRTNQKQFRDKTGFVNRVPDHCLKVAMCLSLARSNDGIISELDITEAIAKVTELCYSNAKAAEGNGLDPLAAVAMKIINHVIASPEAQMLRKDLLIRGHGDYDQTTLDKIIETYMEMGWIKRERVGVGRNMDYLYHLSGEPKINLDKYRKKE